MLKKFCSLVLVHVSTFCFHTCYEQASVEQLGSFFPIRNNIETMSPFEQQKKEKERKVDSVRMHVELHWSMYLTLVQHRAWCFHEWVSHHITYIKHHRFFCSFLHTNHVNATVFRVCMKFISSHSKSICIEEFILLKRAAIKHNYTWSNLMRWTCTIDCCSDRRFLSPISLALFHPFSSNESFMDHYWTFGRATRKEWKRERAHSQANLARWKIRFYADVPQQP